MITTFVGTLVLGFVLAYMIFEFLTGMVGAARSGDRMMAAFNAVLLGMAIWAAKVILF